MSPRVKRKDKMKRYLLIGFFIFTTLFLSINNVYAAGCGDATSTTDNKCCNKSLISATDDIALKNNLGGTWDVVWIPVDQAMKAITRPFNQKIYDLVGTALKPCSYGTASTPGDINDPSCICIEDKNTLLKAVPLCNPLQNSTEKNSCMSCFVLGGIWTTLGCIQPDMRSFIQDTILRVGISIAGGVSLLCIMFAAFQMQTSAGNAEKVKKAQELLTNCITGLMVIIFSMLILKIIGVDILKIPGFI